MKPNRRRILLFVTLLLVFAALFLRYEKRAPKRGYSDFNVYYVTGQRFIAKENIYARPDESITPYKYSPGFAMLFSPLALVSEKAASLIFFTINFVMLLAVFIFSGYLITGDKISFRDRILLYTLSALFSLRFILHVLDSGQVGILMLGFLVLGLYFLRERRDAIGAAFMALAIMTKYTPCVFLPYLIFKGRIKAVSLVLLFILVFCLMPMLYVGVENGMAYVKNWLPFISRTSFDMQSLYDYKNQSLFALAARHFTALSGYGVSVANFTFNQVLFATMLAGAAIFWGIVSPAKSRNFSEPLEYSLLLIVTALFNPNAWHHNFVIFAFVYMTILHYSLKTKFRDRITLALLILSMVLVSFTSELFVGDSLEKVFETFSCVALGSIVLVASLFRLKFRKTLFVGGSDG